MDFSGKVVIITGASSGIGSEAALDFHRFGAKVVMIGRNIENLQATSDKCLKIEGSKNLTPPQIIQADVTIEEDIKRIINETINKFGQIDILVNNAGILEMGSIENSSLEQFDRVMNTNLRSIFHLTMLAVPHLIKTKGNIINVSSVNGIRSFPGLISYNVSKAALDQFTRCVALELAAKGVRCNSINPGVIVTNIHKRGGLDDEAYNNFLQHSKTTHALGRYGFVHEVSAAITFLASEKASFITGISFPVDGGRHAMCPR